MKNAPKIIYLIEYESDESSIVWCDDPAPGEGMESGDATKYIKHEDHLEAMREQREALDKVKIGFAHLQESSEQYDAGCMEILEAIRMAYKEEQINDNEIEKEMDDKGLTGEERAVYSFQASLTRSLEKDFEKNNATIDKSDYEVFVDEVSEDLAKAAITDQANACDAAFCEFINESENEDK